MLGRRQFSSAGADDVSNTPVPTFSRWAHVRCSGLQRVPERAWREAQTSHQPRARQGLHHEKASESFARGRMGI